VIKDKHHFDSKLYGHQRDQESMSMPHFMVIMWIECPLWNKPLFTHDKTDNLKTADKTITIMKTKATDMNMTLKFATPGPSNWKERPRTDEELAHELAEQEARHVDDYEYALTLLTREVEVDQARANQEAADLQLASALQFEENDRIEKEAIGVW
jgi:hypothetical protein